MSPPPWTIEHADEVTSTNDRLKERARAGAPHGTVIAALRQTAGRGRGEASWASPEGGLYASALLRDPAPSVAPILALVAGRAVRDALAGLVPAVRLWVKWPNDILAAPAGADAPEGKACGILVESASSGDHIDWAAIGIGLNLTRDPSVLPGAIDPPAVSIGQWSDAAPSALDLLDAILLRLDDTYRAALADPVGFVSGLEEHLAYRGQAVQVTTGDAGGQSLQGTLVGLDGSGALRLLADDQETRVSAWDARALRPANV